MGSLKSTCTTSYRSTASEVTTEGGIEMRLLLLLLLIDHSSKLFTFWENRAFCILATDRRTDGQHRCTCTKPLLLLIASGGLIKCRAVVTNHRCINLNVNDKKIMYLLEKKVIWLGNPRTPGLLSGYAHVKNTKTKTLFTVQYLLNITIAILTWVDGVLDGFRRYSVSCRGMLIERLNHDSVSVTSPTVTSLTCSMT